MLLQASYDIQLVSFSLVTAVLTAYSALGLIPRIIQDDTRQISLFWLAIASIALGSGVWAMHFIGMLAYQLPLTINYNVFLTLLSLLIPVFMNAAGFSIAFHERKRIHSIAGSLTIGIGIIGMHYTGMAAMHMDSSMTSNHIEATISYNKGIVVLSAIIAIIAATVVVWLPDAFKRGAFKFSIRNRLISAILMGLAISSMHYVAMMAVTINAAHTNKIPPKEMLLNELNIGIGVTLATILLFFLIQYMAYIYKISQAYKKLQSSEATLRQRTRELEFQKFALDEHAIVSIADAQGRITYANDKFCQVSGYNQDQLLGEDHHLLNSGYHPPGFWKEMWTSITDNKVWHGEVKNKTRNGDYYWVETTIVPFFDENNRPYQYISIRTEITAIKQKEHQLERAKEDAESSNEAKAKFISVMSHELYTPLNAIIGGVQLLELSSLSEEQIEYTNIIHNGGNDLTKLIDSILEYSRNNQNQSDDEASSFHLKNCIKKSIDSFLSKAMKNGLSLQLSMSSELPDYIKAPECTLIKVLNNLIDNAIKFTDAGTVDVVVSPGVQTNSIEVEIRDTGTPIPNEMQSQIFQDFAQLESTINHSKSGAGLGLALAKKLVESAGGQIGLRTATESGNVFWFMLPYESPDSI